jgi:serine/threonine protein phosphatase PrpC
MATTCTALWIGRDAVGATVAQVAHVGDSRAYRIRHGAIELLTRDHTLLAMLDDLGTVTPDLRQRYGHILARALGTRDGERVDALTLDVLPGDAFLLCSDGVHGALDDRRLLEIVSSHAVETAAERLIVAALNAGTRDNVTAVVVRVAASTSRHSGIVPRHATPPRGLRTR